MRRVQNGPLGPPAVCRLDGSRGVMLAMLVPGDMPLA